ncbi:hypothetical protein FMM05_08645 [Flavobacterium zepuense]|uniref:Uncharacterized protein n=1 Tax=Flavobacterium zepuense TaxID=2593302 RepID=A0A552V4J7_9FLAO|nr:hypothetical protein [Flavobacterium zepuense]TRW25362.1 hypothetical protein FMM05_08645 [Flavobacterium zepuense]
MKFTEISFPHPVLGVLDAIDSKISLFPEPEIKSNVDFYHITIFFNHDNNDLLELIKIGSAEYFCDVTCSNTLYRKIFTSKDGRMEFEIAKKAVRGRVEFTCLILTTVDIDYTNTNSHVDYYSYIFKLDQGDVLAYFGEFDFDADIVYEKLKAVTSFMEVVENENLTFPYIDLKKSKIEIQLPSQSFKIYCNDLISQEIKYSPIFHSSFVLNALLIALYNFDSHRDFLWARVIEYRLKNDFDLLALSIQEVENIPEIAQKLLGNPFNRLLEGLLQISESTIENE